MFYHETGRLHSFALGSMTHAHMLSIANEVALGKVYKKLAEQEKQGMNRPEVKQRYALASVEHSQSAQRKRRTYRPDIVSGVVTVKKSSITPPKERF